MGGLGVRWRGRGVGPRGGRGEAWHGWGVPEEGRLVEGARLANLGRAGGAQGAVQGRSWRGAAGGAACQGAELSGCGRRGSRSGGGASGARLA